MSIDHPHGGGGPSTKDLIESLQTTTALLWDAVFCQMAGVEGDERTGVRFSLYDAAGQPLERWQAGWLIAEKITLFQGNADRKCAAMHKYKVSCSGLVVTPPAEIYQPVYDGGIQLSNGWYFACSGLRPELDRVYCLQSGYKAEFVSHLRFNGILQQAPHEALVRALYNTAEIHYRSAVSDMLMKGVSNALQSE